MEPKWYIPFRFTDHILYALLISPTHALFSEFWGFHCSEGGSFFLLGRWRRRQLPASGRNVLYLSLGLKMETVRFSETLASAFEFTRSHYSLNFVDWKNVGSVVIVTVRASSTWRRKAMRGRGETSLNGPLHLMYTMTGRWTLFCSLGLLVD